MDSYTLVLQLELGCGTPTLWCDCLSWVWGQWELTDEEVLSGTVLTGYYQQLAETLRDTNTEDMAKEGFYLVKSVLHHCYNQSWHFVTLWKAYGSLCKSTPRAFCILHHFLCKEKVACIYLPLG